MPGHRNDALSPAIRRIHALRAQRDPRPDPNTEGDGRWLRRNARTGSAWGAVSKYRSFVAFALEDREATAARLSRARQALEPGADEDREAYRARAGDAVAAHSELLDRIQYPVESFFVFGKVLLDRTAEAVQTTFGQVNGIGMSSHGDLIKELPTYAARRSLPPPPEELMRKALALEKTLTRFRDHQITHIGNVLYAPVIVTIGDEVDVQIGMRQPSGAEAARMHELQIPRISEMVADLDAFLTEVTDWVISALDPGNEPHGAGRS